MNTYPSYKDSGVEWIGDIPSEWGKSKIKYELKNITTGGTPTTSNEQYWTDEGGINWISISDMTSNPKGVISTKKQITQEGLDSKNLKILPSDSLIYSIYGSIGKVNRIKINSSIHQGILGLITDKKLESKFLEYYLIFLYKDISSFSSGTTQDNLNQEKVNNFELPLPPLQEQQQISDYLDYKTLKIDTLIEKTQQKIELLKEQRTSLINTTVTKGLKPNVEMKDSGVQWIGEIPSKWGFNKVGNNSYVKGRIGWKGLRSEDFIDEGPYLITGTDFNKDGTIKWDNMYHVSQERYDEDPFIQLKDEDVLITKDGTIGKVLYVGNLKGQTCLNSGIFLTRSTTNEYISRFFYWILVSNVFKIFVDYNSGGSTIQHLYQNVFVNFKFPIPPLQEQQLIVDYLDKETLKIDYLIDIESKRIELLKEYRQSLISDVVTGKVDVRNEVLV